MDPNDKKDIPQRGRQLSEGAEESAGKRSVREDFLV